jgi:Predicted membrane protein
MEFYESLKQVLGLGLEPKDLTFVQIALRGVIVFVVSLVMVRFANKRFLSKMTAFDAILGFILASMLARAINGSAAFFPTLGGGFVLVAVHWVIAELSFRSDKFGNLVKGRSQTLVKDGKPDRDAMSSTKISEKDLLEEARLNGQVTRIEDIQLAIVERNGEVSVIPKG